MLYIICIGLGGPTGFSLISLMDNAALCKPSKSQNPHVFSDYAPARELTLPTKEQWRKCDNIIKT